ncbi:hypothetical protein PIB30_065337 [Stylosanthes scabra]|uniref:Uncharacterized protein n=1 Tax=Stylosanthes scabra TaxID=79078 RepID=A0ABU6SMN7_9FABA|nr:hypothetical protein [Stylosanthes scabra]
MSRDGRGGRRANPTQYESYGKQPDLLNDLVEVAAAIRESSAAIRESNTARDRHTNDNGGVTSGNISEGTTGAESSKGGICYSPSPKGSAIGRGWHPVSRFLEGMRHLGVSTAILHLNAATSRITTSLSVASAKDEEAKMVTLGVVMVINVQTILLALLRINNDHLARSAVSFMGMSHVGLDRASVTLAGNRATLIEIVR